MLDAFFSTHHQVVFSSHKRIALRTETFAKALTIAEKEILPPDRTILQNGAHYRRHERLYSLVMEEEIPSTTDYEGYLDRLLFEAIVLHKLYAVEKKEQPSHSNIRSVIVLGWMILDRLSHLLMQVQEEDREAIFSLGNFTGFDKSFWTMSVVGARGEAKALQEMGRLCDIRVFKSTLFEDVYWGIDFFIEVENSTIGACVSVKTRSNEPTMLCMSYPYDKTYAEEWDRVQNGTTGFNSQFHRSWRPILLRIGRQNGSSIDMNIGTIPRWATKLRNALKQEQYECVIIT